MLFLLGEKNITEKYKKYIKTKTIILGSLKNNQIRKNRKKKEIRLLLFQQDMK